MNIQKRARGPRNFALLALQTLAPAVLAIVLSGAASAQDAEPPSLVGRIARIHGDVSMHRADDQDWSAASINEPVTVGDAIYAQEGAGARLQIGAADLELRSDSEIDITNLDQDSGRLRLDTGTLDLRVAALPTDDGLYILTPRGTVRLTHTGLYRIDAGTEDQPTQVTAWTGGAQMGDASTAVTVQAGQMLVITGTPDAPQYSYRSDIGEPPEEWRSPVRVVAEQQQRYVPPDMTGSEDLYQYGAFQTVPDYGTVWYPNDVPVDWQPYRYGHWEVVAPWGRTWIDDSPWGFAPFHYGRWAFIGNRWGWCPGAYEPRPVYAPALVSFIGGGGFGVSIGFGGGDAVGWVPLAPGEAYRPYYRAGPRYIQNINRTVIVNNTTINNTVINNNGPRGPGARLRFGVDRVPTTAAGFANARFATVVPSTVIARGRPVGAAAIRVQPEALARAPINDRVVAAIRPEPNPDRRPARPGPVVPRAAQGPRATAVRPALPPARGQPGQARPQQPAAALPAVPGAPGQRPNNGPQGQPPRPDVRPSPERPQQPAATLPGAPGARPGGPQGQPQQPAATLPGAPGARPGGPQGQPPRPAPERPGVQPAPNAPARPDTGLRPGLNRPQAPTPPAPPQRPVRPERPAPSTDGQPPRPAPERPGVQPAPNAPARPDAGLRPGLNRPQAPTPPAPPQRPVRPERPAPSAGGQPPRPAPNQPILDRPPPNRPDRPAVGQPAPERPAMNRPQAQAPKPEPRPQQAAPRPEPRPQAQAPRPEPRPQQAAPRPEPRPQPQMQRPEPRPQMAPPPQRAAPPPQPQRPVPQPQPQRAAPPPPPPAHGPVKPSDKDKNNN